LPMGVATRYKTPLPMVSLILAAVYQSGASLIQCYAG
jgi:hypothetical protein